ncbi:UDP-N-acetylmuramoyl-tripeptide--D-alanyl-D-alanine ligase [Martelella alba]|uniref:UDP-N-acetylmuramoyl-tripeptide--D-alanyl-D-alanine ligase n=1 Tax=Martelella alba TaxID=2590451 RepID=A0ABY2SUD1_9HYPH|nr:UDP-N-acetylmuramoyl-tripeptide--D-alanyl-D-alanine ligase [Martelella alba]TKI08751.1 UDP-N-acetylmuramoyl-tripeptide--D-alanyl-D-alanine ligase [Martelella alba]
MITVSLQTLATLLDGELVGSDCTVDTVATDSRRVTESCLFVALKGETFDAHDFAAQAVAAGARAILASKRLPLDAPQIVVADTRLALGSLGAWVRRQTSAKVVALTGSSGKTSVKEMTAAILRQCGRVLATAGNFNNDIGVPLTLLRLTPADDFAVIELGANHIGEIAYTVSLVRPDSALVNNLSAAHLAGFGSLDGVARAKGEIFAGLPAGGHAIINADSNDWAHWQTMLGGQTVWRFSVSDPTADFHAEDIRPAGGGVAFVLHTPQGSGTVTLPLPGRHNVANALAASALALSAGASLPAVIAGLAQLKAVPGRLFPIALGGQRLLIDDSYNANVGSMTAAAQVLGDMPGYRVMAVGDMAELGDHAEDCHRQVGDAARAAGIDKVLSVGRLSRLIGEASGRGEHFPDQASLTERLAQLVSGHTVITVLVKGSRSAAMEQVVRALQEKVSC